MFRAIWVGAAVAVGLSTGVRAGSITYAINHFPGAPDMTGTITTDGTIGNLASSDILAWSFTTQGVSATSSDVGAYFNLEGTLSATATGLTLDKGSGLSDLELAIDDGGFFGKKLGWYATAAHTVVDFRGLEVDSSLSYRVQHNGATSVTLASVAVPLPAGVWGGAGLLGVVGAARLVRRR